MAADSWSPRDGKHLEVLGNYNPLPGQDGGKKVGLNFDKSEVLAIGWVTAFRALPTYPFSSGASSSPTYACDFPPHRSDERSLPESHKLSSRTRRR